jgi:L-fucose mutarotase/ribose pyranase (RbsD/FucU family)
MVVLGQETPERAELLTLRLMPHVEPLLVVNIRFPDTSTAWHVVVLEHEIAVMLAVVGVLRLDQVEPPLVVVSAIAPAPTA